jgi:hypothetical protein
MSISINKLMNLVESKTTPVDKKKFGSKELPDKMKGGNSFTQDQYFNLVSGSKANNVGGTVSLGTPDGSNAAPGRKTVDIPKFSRPDGAIDPNRIRELSDPNSALPYRFAGYGLEGDRGGSGIMFGIPNTAKTSSNSIGLIRKAQMSYQNRQSILQPRSAPPTTTQGTNTGKPPSYDESMSDLTPYKDNDSGLNETYS